MVDGSTSGSVHRIGIVGAGAMGASLAALLSRARPVVLVCRNPERAAQLFRHGVEMRGLLEGSARPIVVQSVADLASVGGVGALFIATKTTAIPDVCAELKPVLSEVGESDAGPFVISYQNGIEPGREIMRLLDYERVMRMVLNYGAALREPEGVVEVGLHTPPHYIGCATDLMREECRGLARLLSSSGFETEYVEDIEPQVWTKALANACMSPVAALVNGSIGQVMESPSLGVVEDLLGEGLSVARAAGIDLPEDLDERIMSVYRAGGDHVPSMVEDIRRGRQSEVGQLNRQILMKARELGVSTPTQETIDRLIETFDWRVYQRQASSAWDAAEKEDRQ